MKLVNLALLDRKLNVSLIIPFLVFFVFLSIRGQGKEENKKTKKIDANTCSKSKQVFKAHVSHFLYHFICHFLNYFLNNLNYHISIKVLLRAKKCSSSREGWEGVRKTEASQRVDLFLIAKNFNFF